jgi:hypothetical protein
MGLFSKLFGTATPTDAKTAPSTKQLMAQREAIAGKVMTAERQERIAQAFQAQAAKQQVQQQLKSDAGQRQLAERLQRLLKDG